MNVKDLYAINEDYYYVYEHYLDGQVFYVGKGKKDRAFSLKRNDLWKKHTECRIEEIEVKIKGYFLEESDALFFEEALINKYINENIPLVNISLNLNLEINFETNKKQTEKRKENNNKNLDLTFFNNYKQVVNLIKEEIKKNDKSKFVILCDYKSKVLIETLYNEKSFFILNTVNFTSIGSGICNNKKHFIEMLEKNKIPDNYNIILSSFYDFNFHNFFIEDEFVKLVVLNTRKNYNLNTIQNLIGGKYKLLKNTRGKVNVENAEIIVPEKYINTPLTSELKKKLIKEINIINNKITLRSWLTTRKIINKNGIYNIKDATKTIDGKRTRITIISRSQ